ncbi:MAG TPA: hypothetical protein VFN22_12695 [Gemmatimonadales bacterium]|nr:hypothetical protein [Gemmatimonadales bacterium]
MRTRVLGLLAAGLMAASLPLAAQSSQFGVRGLGHPGRGLAVDALGTAGATGLFSSGSSLNPAALALLTTSLTSFSTLQDWRSTTNPTGSGDTREQRFPLVSIGGPVPKSNWAVGITYASYTNRDFTLVSEGTASPRGIPIGVTDSLGSTGGLSDFRVGVGYKLHESVYLGVGAHLISGSNRLYSNRAWEDTTYTSIRQSTELSYLGFGISGGAIFRLSPALSVAGTVRLDGPLDVERDSVGTGTIEMPLSLNAGVRFQPSTRWMLAAQAGTRTWSRANSGLTDLGGVAARNTNEFSAGLEYYRNRRSPEQLPLRVGVRHADLPFLLVQGSQPRETAVSLGTGVRFAKGVGGLDVALERVHRSQGASYTENAWLLSIGISLRGVLSN